MRTLYLDGRFAKSGKIGKMGLSFPISLNKFVFDYLTANPVFTSASLASTLLVGNITDGTDLIVTSGDVIKSDVGGGTLNLASGGADIVSISTDSGTFAESYLNLTSTESTYGYAGTYLYIATDIIRLNLTGGFSYMGSVQSGIANVADIATTPYALAVADNSAGAIEFTVNDVRAISVNSGIAGTETTFNSGVTKSVALGGVGITAKTNNAAYANKVALNNSGSAFETIVSTATLTADRTATLPNASGNIMLIRTTTTAISASAQNGEIVLGTGGGAGITITLPTPVANDNMQITVKKVDAGVGVVNVASPAGTFDGAASPYTALNTQWESATFVSNGGNWFIISKF